MKIVSYKKERNGEIREEMIVEQQLIKNINYASAGIITRYNHEKDMNELLLIQRSINDSWPLEWEIPRGKCDKEIKSSLSVDKFVLSQLILVGLKREVKEETGLIVEPLKYIDKFMYVFPKHKVIQYSFLCEMTNPNQKVILSHEHEAYKWITSMTEIQLLNVSKELTVVLSKVFNKEGRIIDHLRINK